MKRIHVFVVLLVTTFAPALMPTPVRGDEASAWYLRPEIGLSFVQDFNTRITDAFGTKRTARTAFDPGVRVDLAGGYQFSESWTVEADLGLIYNSVDISTSVNSTSRSMYQVPFMINGIYTLPLKGKFKPYVGAGVGLVLTGLDEFGRDIGGAGQLMLGVKYEVNDRVDVGLGYKLLLTTSHDWFDVFGQTRSDSTITHAIVATCTFKF